MTNKKEMKLNKSIYKVLFNAIREGLFLVNSKGEILDVNAMGEDMFGYDREELLGKNIEVLIPNRLRKKHIENRASYLKKPTTEVFGENKDLEGCKKDNQVFPVKVSLNPLESEEGEQFVVALVEDISKIKKNQERLIELKTSLEEKVEERTQKLRESEHLYKSIARNFPSGVISVFDRSYNYLFAEGQGLYDLNIESSDLIGLNYIERINKETQAKVREELDKVLEGKSQAFEVKVNEQIFAINAVPLSFKNKKVDKILVVERNVTGQAKAAEEMELALKKGQELAEMKSRFVSMASHEFRTPLSTINSSASLIRKYHEKGKCEKIEKHVDRIKNSVQNLTSILNDFLSFEKLERGKIAVTFVKYSVPQLIEETFDEMRDITKSRQILKYLGPDELFIDTDGQLLRNTILNILSNAIKYSDEDGEIIVKLEDKKDDITISIQDFGMGIPEEDQKNLFTRFFRSENVANIEGTGLGLNIVQRYLGLLEGEISFKSILNEGTTFFINLPKIHKS